MNNIQKKLLEEIEKVGPWFHRIDLGEGIWTCSKSIFNENVLAPNPEEKWKLIEPYIPKDLTGKTVLDLGCSSGFFSIQMKKRGAKQVVSVDFLDEAIKQTDFLSRWFNVELDIVKSEAHVFCLTTEERFDYVLFLGLFYYLKYPVVVLDRLGEMTNSRMYFQSATIGQKISEYIPQDDYSRDNLKSINDDNDFPKLLFIEKKFGNDPTNWWLPNDSAMISLLRNAKLKIIARPSKSVYVCEPENGYGKTVYQNKLIFPNYGKDL